jgi:hypothetical protein
MDRAVRENSEPSPLIARVRVALPLLLLGAVLLVGAWVASADRLRVFSSPYPVWILLSMNATVILGAGFVGAFILDPSALPEDDPDLIYVPRSQWEALLSGVARSGGETAERVSAPRPPEQRTNNGERPEERSPRLIDGSPAALVPPRDSEPPTSTEGDASDLRREMAIFELRGIAEAALTTNEKLGGDDLRALLEGYAVDLAHLSEILEAPQRRNEAPGALLLRLLHRSLRAGILSSEWRIETQRLVDRIEALDSGLTRDGVPNTPVKELDQAAEELEALVSELEPKSATRRRPAENAGEDRDATSGDDSED